MAIGRKIPTLLIPVENQVRELDPKLLLACIAARRGFSSVIGSRREMEMRIDAFPRSIYLSKSMTVRSLLFFQVAHRLGHEIITWDEEALVHLPPETYFSRRLHPSAISYVSHLLAWGEDNAELWRRYPALPAGTPIHVTGNPRGDFLRPELRRFHQAEARALRSEYGSFILVNTNFNHVNAFGPDMNLFKPAKTPGRRPAFGRAARGMSRSYAEGLRDHKLAVFEDFQELIPRLEAAFPDQTIVVRPHPTENHAVYGRIAAGCRRVKVTNEGNVVPWLMATRAVVHNGCTTGVEAYALGVPALSYRATVNEAYDYGFYRLPNLISHQCFDFAQLRDRLGEILAGELGAPDGDARQALFARHMAAQDGPLACERIVAVIEEIGRQMAACARPIPFQRQQRWLISQGLQALRHVKTKLPGSHNRPEFQRHRYPGLPLEAFRAKLQKLQQTIGDDTAIDTQKITDAIFTISPKERRSAR
jgi:surface carbohydrate biosynthesis protein